MEEEEEEEEQDDEETKDKEAEGVKKRRSWKVSFL